MKPTTRMAAVVRVKRCLDEEPNSAFILSCKRRKTDANIEDAVETLFKFAGTVKNQEENITLLTPDKLTSKANVKTSCCRPVPDLSKKVRSQTKAASNSNRYKLVNYFRTINDKDLDDGAPSDQQNSITVLDVEAQSNEDEDSVSPRDAPSQTSQSAEYVYDLYYIQPNTNYIDVDDLLLDGLVSFAPVENELVFDSYRNHRGEGGNDSDSPGMDDDDDSNDENNWRNDYPDGEEGGNSDEDQDLAHGFGRVTFGDEELSSDSDDERLIYSENLSPTDVKMFGLAYASFKKKVLREMNSDVLSTDSDDDYKSSKSENSDKDS